MTFLDTQSKWDESFLDPSAVRKHKPRQQGVTMIIDKGMGYHQFKDFTQLAADYTDFIKLGFGTSVLYPTPVLQQKIELAKRSGIDLYPGGTFFEIALFQKKLDAYFETIYNRGFETIEISDGSTFLCLKDRAQVIDKARSYGFKIITEYGKKEAGSKISLTAIRETLENDLEHGASFMIVEGRESGRAVGVFDDQGQIDQQEIMAIREQLGELSQYVIWEAPQKQQQVEFMQCFGTNVNLGNIANEDILSVESLRRGLRADTLGFNLITQPQ